MKLGRRDIVVAAVLLCVMGCGSDNRVNTPPAISGPPILIAFQSNRPPSTVSGGDIWFYDASRQGPAYLPPNLNTPSDEGPGSLSGDGKWFAYTSTRLLVGTTASLFRYELSSGLNHVVQSALAYRGPLNPSFSYDGRRLAFQTQVGGPFDQEIALVDAFADTVIPTPSLHEFGAADFDPSLSGDGSLIAFTSNRSTSLGSFDIVLYDVPGDSIVALPGLNTAFSDIGVTISTDGRYLAFHSNRPGGQGAFDVYLYDRETSTALSLPGANTPLSDVTPGISPDGRYVAFWTENDGGGNIRLYDVRDQALIQVPGLNDDYFQDRYPTIANLPGSPIVISLQNK